MYEYLGPQVVIVDDKKEEVIGIIDSLVEKGIGCRFFNADISDGDNQPKKPFDNVKILFLDLFYNIASETDFDPYIPAGWVDSIIPDNSYYILVIWSKDTHRADAVLQILKKNFKEPLLLLNRLKESYHHDSSLRTLIEDVEIEVNKYPGVKELLIWQQGISSTVNTVINTICSNKEELETKIKKIVFAHGGESIKEKSYSEKREALNAAMDEVLTSRSKHFRCLAEISPESKELYRNIETTPGVDCELNSWFIFEKTKFVENEYGPGVIFESTDNKLDPYAFSESPDFSKLSPNGNVGKNLISKNIYMIINPGCNLSQNNLGAGYKFLSGLIVDSLSNSSKKGSDPIKMIENIKIDDFKKGIILFDMRYVFTIPESEMSNYKMNSIAQFSKSVFNDVQIAYTSYASRIGYTSLR